MSRRTLLNLGARIERVANRNKQKLAKIEKITGANLGEIDRVRYGHPWTIDDLLGYAQQFGRLPELEGNEETNCP